MSENSATARILVADDERSIRWVLSEALTADGHQVSEAATGTDALAILNRGATDVAFLDIRMPDMNGLDVVSKAREAGCQTTLIVMTAQTTMANAVEAMKRGAYDYLTKPFDLDVVRMLVTRVLETRQLSSEVNVLKGELRKRYEVGVDIIGRSPAMQNIYKLLGRVAKNDATVLIEGESGTGKELIAKAIHYHSPRWQGPFVALNCSAIPRELLESELFGFERGAFTGAIERRAGKFEQAAGGTLFLDEVADMPLELQAKLLRVLQEREFTRVGGRESLRTDVRIVAATNQELARAVRASRFREDLYFRLNVVPIHVPPLRERKSDIPELIRFFIAKINRDLGTEMTGIAPGAEAMLMQYSWPGNVRELENSLVRASVLAPGRTLMPTDFALAEATPPQTNGDSLAEVVRRRTRNQFEAHGERDPVDVYATLLMEFERPLLEATLERTNGNQVRAAQILGINRNTLRKKLTQLGLAPRRAAG
ncbi:nitrogen regulation protein NR(I) [Candidatus Binatia bacterium]|jgi:two-component system nitrogen regulation response regulator GlnG|nr:nitrogen regulation protein NR(I) [Candidatus Binatia bacterium]